MSDLESITRDELFDTVWEDFHDESGQLLDRLNESLLQLDEWVQGGDDDRQRPDNGLLDEMVRAVRSLNTLSAKQGLDDLNNLAHKMENLLDAARNHNLVIDTDVMKLMFQGLDRLVGQVDALKYPDAEPVQCNSVIEDMCRLLQSAGVEPQQSSQPDAEQTPSKVPDEAGAESPQSASEDTPHNNSEDHS